MPGVGFVSKMAVDNLVKEEKAEKIATLYSPHFPNQVLALKSGKLKPFTMRFYVKKLKARDIVFLRGDLQPLTVEGQYEVSSKVLEYFNSIGGKDVISMAGYAVSKPGQSQTIYGYSTSLQTLKTFSKLGVKQSEFVVPIVGMAGLLPTLSKAFGLNGTCLLVETTGVAIDANGSKQLITLLGKWLGQKFSSASVENRAKKAQKLLQRIEAQARKEEGAGIADIPMPSTAELLKKDVLSYIR